MNRVSAGEVEVAPGVAISDGVVTRSHPPAPDLARYFFDYVIHDSGPANARVLRNRYLPGPANICLTFDAGPLNARIRNFTAQWDNASMVVGPTSHMFEVESNGGRLIGAGVTPAGWARLFGVAADRLANRIVPLGELIGAERDAALRDALSMAPDDRAIVAVMDAHLRMALAPAGEDEPAILALQATLLDAQDDDVAMLGEHLGLTPDKLRRVACRYFGFNPKLLLRRHRLVRALMALSERPRGATDGVMTDLGYHDRSHFIRDAKLFLGVTGRQFLRDITPLMDNLRRSRAARYGQPLQGLLRPGADNVTPLDAPAPTP